MHRYKKYRYTKRRYINMQIYRYIKYTDAQIYKYTDIQAAFKEVGAFITEDDLPAFLLTSKNQVQLNRQ